MCEDMGLLHPDTITKCLADAPVFEQPNYSAAEVEGWAARIAPFLASGSDAFVFFRHDESGRGPELAAELRAAVDRVLA